MIMSGFDLLFDLFSFFFNDTATTEIYTLSLHDALPISPGQGRRVLLVQNLELGAVDPDAAVGDLDLSREAAEDRVVAQQMGDHLRVDQVIDRDELEIGPRGVGRAD